MRSDNNTDDLIQLTMQLLLLSLTPRRSQTAVYIASLNACVNTPYANHRVSVPQDKVDSLLLKTTSLFLNILC